MSVTVVSPINPQNGLARPWQQHAAGTRHGVHQRTTLLEDALLEQQGFSTQKTRNTLNKRLYQTQLPLSGMLGLLSYALFKRGDQSTQTVDDFTTLLGARGTILRRLAKFDREPDILSGEANLVAKQLRVALTTGKPPHVIEQHLRSLQQASAQSGMLKSVATDTQLYLKTFSRVSRNQAGLFAIAETPVISNLIGRSPAAGKALIERSRNDFFKVLFEKALYGQKQSDYVRKFAQLKQANNLRAMLFAATVAVTLMGMFVTARELKLKALAKQGI